MIPSSDWGECDLDEDITKSPFVREGRALHEWLPDLISPDSAIRQHAGDALAAMFFGVPTVHTDIEGVDWSKADGDEQQKRWYAEVRRAVERPDFPRRLFLVGLAARILGAQDEYMRQWCAADVQFDRVLDRISKRLDAEGPDRHEEHLRRLARAFCASIERSCDPSQTAEAFTFAGMVPQWIFPAIGPTILDAPEALWMLIESDSHALLAYESLRAVGPPAAPMFLDHMIDQFKRSKVDGCSAGDATTLAIVGRGNVQLIELLLDAIQNWPTSGTRAAAWTLQEMGESVRAHPQALSVLLGLTSSGEGQRRAAAAMALGGVARGIDDAIESLLRLTHDTHPDEEGHNGHIVVGNAISALGKIGRRPDLVVPRLIELFDTYVEFDPDEEYGGRNSRICGALQEFGHAAAPAIPRLIAHLESALSHNPEDWFEQDVVKLLATFGPTAIDAVPVLERTDRMLVEWNRQQELDFDEDEDEDSVNGVREADESNRDEESPIRKAIPLLSG